MQLLEHPPTTLAVAVAGLTPHLLELLVVLVAAVLGELMELAEPLVRQIQAVEAVEAVEQVWVHRQQTAEQVVQA